MSKINDKLGIAPNTRKRPRLNSLTGVTCPVCPHSYVTSNVVQQALVWLCGFCGHNWRPTLAEIQRYNGRVRERDRITVPP